MRQVVDAFLPARAYAPFYEQEVVKAAYKASINFFRISLLERMAGSRAGEAWRSEPLTLGRGVMLAYVGERTVLRSPIYRRIPRRPVTAAIEFTSLPEAVVALVR
jgi:hypothetical protein